MIVLEYILRNIILRSKMINNLMSIDIWKLLCRRIFNSSYCQPLCMSRFMHLVIQQIFIENLLYAGTISAIEEFNVKYGRHKKLIKIEGLGKVAQKARATQKISQEECCGCFRRSGSPLVVSEQWLICIENYLRKINLAFHCKRDWLALTSARENCFTHWGKKQWGFLSQGGTRERRAKERCDCEVISQVGSWFISHVKCPTQTRSVVRPSGLMIAHYRWLIDFRVYLW